MPRPFSRSAPPAAHFPVGGPVPGADLIGREAYLRGLVTRLQDGSHLVVSGPRRIGKTSVVLEALRRLGRRGSLTAYVDCMGATDLHGFGERLADAVLFHLTGTDRSVAAALAVLGGERPPAKVRFESLEPALALARETNAQRFFDQALDLPRLVAARTGKRLVIALDEFQSVGRLSPKVFDLMRSRFQAQRGVAYVFLGSEAGTLAALFGEKGRAFYRFAVPHDLTGAGEHRFGIAPDHWADYLRTKFKAKQIQIAEAELDWIIEATGGHPQDAMQLSAALLYFMQDQGLRVVTADTVAVAYEQTLRELERPFALHWEELGTQKYLQAIAKRIAHGAVLYATSAQGAAVPRPEVLRALETLRQKGLVVRLGRGRYEFVEPMFGEHVRRLDEGLPGIVTSR